MSKKERGSGKRCPHIHGTTYANDAVERLVSSRNALTSTHATKTQTTGPEREREERRKNKKKSKERCKKRKKCKQEQKSRCRGEKKRGACHRWLTVVGPESAIRAARKQAKKRLLASCDCFLRLHPSPFPRTAFPFPKVSLAPFSFSPRAENETKAIENEHVRAQRARLVVASRTATAAVVVVLCRRRRRRPSPEKKVRRQ